MQFFSGKIDRYYKRFSWLLIVIVALCVFVIGPIVLHKSTSGKEAKQQTYNLSKDSEGVKKMNKLLADLLLIEDTSVVSIKNLQDLNMRYKALTFSLPYADDIEFSESSFIHTSDIRLVDIDPAKIAEEKDKDQFYNSNLQNLLEKQRSEPSVNFFKIRFKKENGQIRIRDIKLVTSLFRVNFDKKVWRGSIEATDYGLFREGEFCFLSWGKNILPIKRCEERGRPRRFTADLTCNEFLLKNAPIQMVGLSMREYNTSVKEIVVGLDDRQESIGTMTLRYVADTMLLVKTDENLECVFYAIGGGLSYIKPTSSAGRIDSVSFSHDLKVAFYDRQKNKKIAEMHLTHKNPIFTMACPIRNRHGFSRYSIDASLTDRFTQQVTRGVFGMLADTKIDTTIQLTLDPYLSKWLEEELKTYTDSLRERFARDGIGEPDDRWEMSATVVDMRTGAILAMPYYRSEDEKLPLEVTMVRKNPALTRRYIGSVFKPLLALAAVQTEPALINLNTETHPPTCRVINISSNKSESRAEMFGYPVPYWGSVGHWKGRESMELFLAASCDVYPVAMTILALNGNQWPRMAGEDVFTTVGSEGLLGLKREDNGHHHWNNMDLMKNIDRLYGVKSFFDAENEDDAAYDMKRNIWRNIPGWDTLGEDRTNYVDVVTPDFTVMRYQDFNNEGTSVKGNLVPWVLGQGNNSWSCLKLAEAWCRMLTKRKVEVSITNPGANTAEKIQFDKDGWDGRWNTFLDKLDSAQRIRGRGYGLLSPMYDAVANLNNNMDLQGNDRLMLFSKTGTPANYDWKEYLNIDNTKLRYDVGLYCMGLMTEGVYNSIKQGGISDGIVCVIRITRISTKKDNKDGLWSYHARDFFSANQQRLKEFYWLTRTRFGQ